MNCNNVSFASTFTAPSAGSNTNAASHPSQPMQVSTGRSLTPYPGAYVSEPMMTYSRDSEDDWSDTDSDDSSSCYSQSPSECGSVYRTPPQTPPQTRYADDDRSFVSPYDVHLIRAIHTWRLHLTRAQQSESNPIVWFTGGSPATSGFTTPAVTTDNSSSGSMTPTSTTGLRVFTGSAGSVPRVLRVVNGPISPMSPVPTLRVVNNPSAPISPPGSHDISTVFSAMYLTCPPRTLQVVNGGDAIGDDGMDINSVDGGEIQHTRYDSIFRDCFMAGQDTSELFGLSTPSPECGVAVDTHTQTNTEMTDHGGFFDINAYHGHGNATKPDNSIHPYDLPPNVGNDPVRNVPLDSIYHPVSCHVLANSGWNCMIDYPVSTSPRQSAASIRSTLRRFNSDFKDLKAVGQTLFIEELIKVNRLRSFTPFSYTKSFQPRTMAMEEMEGEPMSPKSRG